MRGKLSSGSSLRVVFAGDRSIAVSVLQFMLEQGCAPVALCVSGAGRASHDRALIGLCAELTCGRVLRGPEFRSAEGIELLASLAPDYILCVHFPYIVPREVLDIPRIGVVNLHPAFLPYNRGWHTPSWAILEGTPIGATLHFMDDGIDTGDIIHRKELAIRPEDTADSLYQRLMCLELEVLVEAWPDISSRHPARVPQDSGGGTSHMRKDLLRPEVREIEVDSLVRAGDLITRLRALTTDRLEESAYFTVGDRSYHVQIRIVPADRRE